MLINPEDIAYPVSLNLFSVGQERLDGYSPLEKERLTNSIIELYDFVLGSLLSAGHDRQAKSWSFAMSPG